MSNTIGSSRESNSSRRICDLGPVPLGHMSDNSGTGFYPFYLFFVEVLLFILFLFQHVVTFWRNLQWPDPVDAYTIALRLTDDMANAIEKYADLVYKKLKDVGFFDDEGQFDVTEALCLALNNLQVITTKTASWCSGKNLSYGRGRSGVRFPPD